MSFFAIKSLVDGASSYRSEIDGLRCIAVCSVIFYHAGFSLFSGGYVGVDIFFVISGYLITSIIYSDVINQKFSFRVFYERRVRRIFPALFLVLGVTSVAAYLLLLPPEFKFFSQSLFSVVFFIANFFFWLKSSYFDPQAEELHLLHTWSLSVEEQFYIFMPFILILGYRFFAARVALLVLFIAGLSLVACLYFEKTNPNLNFFFVFTRSWELMAGALIALYSGQLRNFTQRHATLVNPLSLLGILLVILPIFLYGPDTSFPGAYAILPVLGTALIIAFGGRGTLVGRILSTKGSVSIGLVSYSAYLWHQPIFVFARSYGIDQPIEFLPLIAVVFILSYATWHFVENPFRRVKTISRRALWIYSSGALVIVTAIGLGGHLTQGYPHRFADVYQEVVNTAQPSPMRSSCHTDGEDYLAPHNSCNYFSDSHQQNWVVMGDSHAVELSYALAKRLESQEVGVKHLSFSGCPPVLSVEVDNPGCTRWLRESVEYLENHQQLKNIVIIYRHSFYLYGDHMGSYPKLPNQHPVHMSGFAPEAARDLYKEGLVELVNRLTNSGKNVFLLEPIPELPGSVSKSIYKSPLDSLSGKILGADLNYYEQRQKEALELIRRFESDPKVTVISSYKSVCDSENCYAVDGGQALYFDDNHLSLYGADKLARLILNYFQFAPKHSG